MIVAVHTPRFPLLVALLRAGRPIDAPVALGPQPGALQVVGLCTPAAQAEGVCPGLRVGEALARCPSLRLVAPDPVAVADAAERLIERLEALGAAVEPGDPGSACLCTRGLTRLYGGLDAVVRRVRAALPVGADGRVGVAPSRFAALQAAHEASPRHPLVVGPAEMEEFLAPLSIARLPLPEQTLRVLDELGLRTLGQVAALPRAAVLERLGISGLHAWRLARGEDATPLRPRRPPEPLSAAVRFPEPLGALPALHAAGTLILDELAGAARRRGRALRALVVRAQLADGGSWARRLTMREATADPERLALVVLPSLGEIAAPVEALTIEADASGSTVGRQLALTVAGVPERAHRAREALRQVRAAHGEESVLRAVELEPWSRLPERRWALVPYDA